MRYSTIKIGLMIGLIHILSTSSFCAKTSIPSIQSFAVEGCTTCKADTTDLPDDFVKAVQKAVHENTQKGVECAKQFEYLKRLAADDSKSNDVAEEVKKVNAKIIVANAYYSGSFSYNGSSILLAQDWKTASSYFNIVAENNHYERGYLICGLIYEYGGAGINKDNKLASKYYHKFIDIYDQVDQQLDGAYNQLALCYLHDGDSLTYFKTLKEGFEKGCTLVCCNLGNCYKNGIGVTRSYNDAFKVFQKGLQSCDDYTVLVCKYRLALLYRDGNGCDKDPVKSKAMLEEVAQKGYMRAKYILAEDNYKNASYTTAFTYCNELYSSKDESLKDVRGAVCTMLAKMYQFGRGVEANQTEAEKWWKEAAECGDTDAIKIQKWLYSN